MMAESKVVMDLWIDTQNNTVLFAEVGKDCVDFLFHILSLPIATVIRLVTKQDMLGSVANLYESVENLNEAYMQSGQDKNILLKPDKNILLKPMSVAREPGSVPLLRLNDALPERNLFTSVYPRDLMTTSNDTSEVCPNCRQNINLKMTYVAPPTPLVRQERTERGYVKGVAKYFVMDDLVVKPAAMISVIRLFKQLGVKDVSVLQEKQVILGSAEAVKILKTCLHSKNVLTEVFLKKELNYSTAVEDFDVDG